MIVDVLERAERALLNAFEALDSPRPDHDVIKERIAGALAAAQVIRAKVARDIMKLKFEGYNLKRIDSGSEPSQE